nr:hypothetical protein [Pseudomonas sp.]
LGGVIDQVYQALFQREPDVQGKAFYMAAFAQGTLAMGNIVLAILQGAQAEDLAAINNKLAVAREFTRQVDGRAFHDADFGNGWDAAYAYAGQASAVTARTMLAGVTADPATVLDAAAITRILQGENAVEEDESGRVPCDSTPGDSTPDDSALDNGTPDTTTPDSDSTPGGSRPDDSVPGDSRPIDSRPDASSTISFVTGDADDTILVQADGTAGNGASIWIQAGDGNDAITVDSTGHVRMTLSAGAGDDTVILASGISSVTTRDRLDGGEGFDTLVMDGGRLTQADYAALDQSLSDFEAVEFLGRADVDAGRLSQFERIGFAAGASEADVARAQTAWDVAEWALFEAERQEPKDPALIAGLAAARDAAMQAWQTVSAAALQGSSSVVGVAEAQVLLARGSLHAWAEGYRAATQDEEAAPYVGALNIVVDGTHSTISAYSQLLNLSVVTPDLGDSIVSLEGDVANAVVQFVQTNDDDASAVAEAGRLASLSFSTSGNQLAALSSISIKGPGHVVAVNNDGSMLKTVDASGMTSVLSAGASHGDKLEGLIYISSNSNAETIFLGAGVDHVTLSNTTVDNMDVVEN